ncbi:hypothetical protein F5Y18DRAFT_326629 [Xylariaceae sp. FL1019]|nr:hypothetical protein F5Y18DRAFT_326629 [Xylariaceae sp. FL1019]
MHSGYAPGLVTLDPKYYNDPGKASKEIGAVSKSKPSGVDLDRYFYSKGWQKRRFGNCVVQEVLPLNRYTWESPSLGWVSGGHGASDKDPSIDQRDLFWKDCVKVNEKSWFPFFKKARWFDLVDATTKLQTPAKTKPPLPPGGPWSISNPRIWARLRVALEVANRMLHRMVTDRHPTLETLLFGRMEYWNSFTTMPPRGNPQDVVLLSATREPIISAAEGCPPWQSP